MALKTKPIEFIEAYLDKFPSGSTSWITNPPWIAYTINNIYQLNNIDFTNSGIPSRMANIWLSNFLNVGYEPLSKSRLIESNKNAILAYKGQYRNSGRPGAIHPLSVEFILSKLLLPDYVIIAGLNHDNVEDQIEKRKKEHEGKIKPELLEKITSDMFKEQFLSLKKINEKTAKDHDEEFRLKEVLYSTIILQKVTRVESDNNYYQSIERIFDMDFDYEKSMLENGLSGVFEEYNITSGEKVTFSDAERRIIVENAIMVKLADRISNTLDTYPKQTFKGRLKDIFKSLYMINRVKDYLIKSKSSIKGYSSRENYKKIEYLKNVLLEANKKVISESLNTLLRSKGTNTKHKNVPMLTQQQIDIVEKDLKEYKVKNGFASLDYGFDENYFSGLFRGTYNKIIDNDEKITNRINTSPFEQYLSLKCMSEVNTLLESDNILLEGFRKLETETLGYYDSIGYRFDTEKDMLTKNFTPQWIYKRDVRRSKGVLTNESYYEIVGKV